MNKKILKQLKSDYEKLEIKPSPDLWDRIDSLDQKSQKRSDLSPKAHFQWWKYAAVVLLLISVGTIIYYNVNNVEQHNTLSRNQTHQINDKDLKGIQKKQNNENILLPDSEPVETKPEVNNTNQNKIADHSIRPDKKIEYTQSITKKQNSDLNHTPVQVASADHQIKRPDGIVEPEEKTISDNKLAVSTEKSETKNTKYIKASDLLTGREYDKIRGNQETTSYGKIDLSRLKPHFLQVVTLGVTVHSDTK